MNLLRLLGIARLPFGAASLIPPNERVLVCEHLFCSITFRNFRSPGRACDWNRQWFVGSIAVSDRHIIAFRGRRRLINTAFDDPRFFRISFSADDYNLYITHDAGLYRDDWSGQIECRFHAREAQQIATVVRDASIANVAMLK